MNVKEIEKLVEWYRTTGRTKDRKETIEYSLKFVFSDYSISCYLNYEHGVDYLYATCINDEFNSDIVFSIKLDTVLRVLKNQNKEKITLKELLRSVDTFTCNNINILREDDND